jgi:DNA repair protein RecO (recombination protein O)
MPDSSFVEKSLRGILPMSVQKTKAIALGSHPLGEADRIVTFYTGDFGRIRAVARGGRKVKSRLCGRLEILTYGDLVFFERVDKDLHVVNSFDIIESFQVLREDLLKMAYCSYLAELLQQVEPLRAPNADIFTLVLEIMFLMKGTDDPEILVRTFELRFLTAAGFEPQLDICVICSGNVDSAGTLLGFSVGEGGVVCSKCRGETSGRDTACRVSTISISRGTLELMKRLQRTPLELISRLRMHDVSRRELKKLLRNFISFHAGIGPLRSLDFLASIESDMLSAGCLKTQEELSK